MWQPKECYEPKIIDGRLIYQNEINTVWLYSERADAFTPMEIIRITPKGYAILKGMDRIPLHLESHKWKVDNKYANITTNGTTLRGFLDWDSCLTGTFTILNQRSIQMYASRRWFFSNDDIRFKVYASVEMAFAASLKNKIELYFDDSININEPPGLWCHISAFVRDNTRKFVQYHDSEIKSEEEFKRKQKERIRIAKEREAQEERRRIAEAKKNSPYKTYIMINREGQYKIGKSKEPNKRHYTLMAQDPSQDIKLIAICETDIETILHKKYRQNRIRGEWYDITPQEVNNIILNYNFERL